MPAARLRLARPDDAARLAAIYAPSVTDAATSFEETPPDADEFARRLVRVSSSAPWLVCEDRGLVVGYAYASRHHERAAYRWSVDSAVYIDAGHHRRGVGKALYTALFELLELQGFAAVHAGVTLPNPASVGLHESFGFRPVAVYPKVGFKLGRWHDVGWWQLELRARTGEPQAPIDPEQARARDAARWAAALEAGERLLTGSVR